MSGATALMKKKGCCGVPSAYCWLLDSDLNVVWSDGSGPFAGGNIINSNMVVSGGLWIFGSHVGLAKFAHYDLNGNLLGSFTVPSGTYNLNYAVPAGNSILVPLGTGFNNIYPLYTVRSYDHDGNIEWSHAVEDEFEYNQVPREVLVYDGTNIIIPEFEYNEETYTYIPYMTILSTSGSVVRRVQVFRNSPASGYYVQEPMGPYIRHQKPFFLCRDTISSLPYCYKPLADATEFETWSYGSDTYYELISSSLAYNTTAMEWVAGVWFCFGVSLGGTQYKIRKIAYGGGWSYIATNLFDTFPVYPVAAILDMQYIDDALYVCGLRTNYWNLAEQEDYASLWRVSVDGSGVDWFWDSGGGLCNIFESGDGIVVVGERSNTWDGNDGSYATVWKLSHAGEVVAHWDSYVDLYSSIGTGYCVIPVENNFFVCSGRTDQWER